MFEDFKWDWEKVVGLIVMLIAGLILLAAACPILYGILIVIQGCADLWHDIFDFKPLI